MIFDKNPQSHVHTHTQNIPQNEPLSFRPRIYSNKLSILDYQLLEGGFSSLGVITSTVVTAAAKRTIKNHPECKWKNTQPKKKNKIKQTAK